MSAINRVPQGLLALLGIKQLGRNPNQLAETSQPIVDVTQMYASEKGWLTAEAASPAGAILSSNQYAPIEIPAGESWYVYNVTTTVFIVSVNSAFNCGPALTMPDAQQRIPYVLADPEFLYTTFAQRAPGSSCSKNAWLGGIIFPSGSVFGCWVDNVISGATDVVVRTAVHYSKLET